MDKVSEQATGGIRIDFHVHLGVYNYHHPWATEWMKGTHGDAYETYIKHYDDPAAFEELLTAEGVDYACVLAELSHITTGVCTNERVRDFCKGRSRLIPFCDVNPHIFTKPEEELRRLVEHEGFRGLKLYPTYQHYYLNDPRMYPVYHVAEELGIPVLIHMGSSVFRGSRLKYGDPVTLDDVAVDFPGLNLVMAHSGRGFWYQQAFFLSKLHPHVYMEISGLPPSKLLDYFPEFTRNVDKIIFGSDWPGMPNISRNMEAVAALPLPPGGADKILGDNAARLLGVQHQ